jgi:hypothetical protein
MVKENDMTLEFMMSDNVEWLDEHVAAALLGRVTR